MDIAGGAERLLLWLAQGLGKRGLDVTIFTERFNPRFTDGHIKVEVFKKGLLNRFINSKLIDKKSYAKQLSCLLKDFSTVVSFNFPSYWWVAEAKELSTDFPNAIWFCNEPLRRLYRDKTDRFLMDYYSKDLNGYNTHLKEEVQRRLTEDRNNLKRQERDREIDKLSVSAMDKVLAISHYTAQNLKSIFGIESIVCYPGIPDPSLRSGQALNVRSDNTILTIGWSSPKKNINNVLEAVKILSKRNSALNFRLKIIGYDARLSNIRGLIENLGITDMVELIGYVGEEELFEHYRSAKAVVYIPVDEPFGLVPVEAMMCGTPVIVSNHGGPKEMVQDGKTGIHVDPFDPHRVADAIERLLKNEKLVDEMGQNGYNLVRENFTIDHFVERFLDEITIS
jgi:glycosyltransferase involved in cell wall biosynthesis